MNNHSKEWLIDRCKDLEDACASLQARLESLEKDAARYMKLCMSDFAERDWVDTFEEYKAMRDAAIDAMKG